MKVDCIGLLGNTLVALGIVLVTADLHVLPLALVHELLENGIIVLGDGLGRHLDGAVTTGLLDIGGDVLNSSLQHLDTLVLVQRLVGQDVKRRSNQLDLDLVLGGVVGLGGAESLLDGVDTLVAEAGDLDIGTDLGRVRGELLADVLLQLLLDGLAGELDLVPDVGVAVRYRPWLVGLLSRAKTRHCSTYVIEILKASWEWPYFRFKGQAICW
jgi:hypothetical protein